MNNNNKGTSKIHKVLKELEEIRNARTKKAIESATKRAEEIIRQLEVEVNRQKAT